MLGGLYIYSILFLYPFSILESIFISMSNRHYIYFDSYINIAKSASFQKYKVNDTDNINKHSRNIIFRENLVFS